MWTTRRRFSKRRTTRRNGSARRGVLVRAGIKAREYKGSDPIFRGRIMVDRGTGVLEFPAPNQFMRIAREEGVPAEDVRRAFGHMRGLTPNVQRTVRKGMLQFGDFLAEEVPVTPELASRFPERATVVGIATPVGIVLKAPEDTLRDAKRAGFTADDFHRAFGHMVSGRIAQATGAKTPTVYGPRRMKLGHIDDQGVVRPGIHRGQLVLFDAKSGLIAWRADEHRPAPGEPPQITIKGRLVAFDKAFREAVERRNIPESAFVQAFGHLLGPAAARELARAVRRRGVD